MNTLKSIFEKSKNLLKKSKKVLNKTLNRKSKSKNNNTNTNTNTNSNTNTNNNSIKKSSTSSNSNSKKSSSNSTMKKSSPSSSKTPDETEKTTKSKIKKLLSANIQNRSENLGKMLKNTCKNPDNCIALGYYGDVIKRYFDNFENMNLIDNTSLKRIGRESTNGFIIEVPFKKNNYTAYTALKCCGDDLSEDSVEDEDEDKQKDKQKDLYELYDNLLYEYYVGKNFINKYAKIYPCFVETYGLYEFKGNIHYNIIKTKAESNNFSKIDFKQYIQKVNIEEFKSLEDIFNYSCFKNKLLCVLIQHFDNFVSFHDARENSYDNLKYDLYNIMYQAYFCLAMLGDNYTHYDLHANNVFLYKPFDGNKCILMKYHHNGKVFEFKSEFIVKIIDYGRNYFNNEITNTKEIMEKICNLEQCQPNCGKKIGYRYIQGNIMRPKRNFYWINPVAPNVSYDLRFADYIQSEILKFVETPLIGKIDYKEDWGTPEVKEGGDKRDIKNIFNLLDSLESGINDSLESGINEFNHHKNHKKYADWTVAATMDVYDDGREYTFDVLPVP